jgi:hypothetical protein
VATTLNKHDVKMILRGKWANPPCSENIRLGSDDRKGLGYGTLDPVFNHPRNLQGNFPYLDVDPYADDEIMDTLGDEELDAFVARTNLSYLPTDFLAALGTDPYYFVAGNTPMHELATQSSSANPVPPKYQGRKHGPMLRTGSAFPYPGGGGTNYKRTGTLQGYFHAPPPSKADPELGQFPVYNLRDMPEAGERTLEKLRVLVAAIVQQQEEAKEQGG